MPILPIGKNLPRHTLTYMEKHMHPLPLRVQPQPWEDLHSFLTRTAHRMHYDKATQILQPELGSHHITSSHISLLTEQADYTLLSDLLLLPQDTLYQMTLHRFSAPFQQVELFPVLKDFFISKNNLYLHPATPTYHAPIPQPRLAPGLRRNFFLPNQTTQICPLCRAAKTSPTIGYIGNPDTCSPATNMPSFFNASAPRATSVSPLSA